MDADYVPAGSLDKKSCEFDHVYPIPTDGSPVKLGTKCHCGLKVWGIEQEGKAWIKIFPSYTLRHPLPIPKVIRSGGKDSNDQVSHRHRTEHHNAILQGL